MTFATSPMPRTSAVDGHSSTPVATLITILPSAPTYTRLKTHTRQVRQRSYIQLSRVQASAARGGPISQYKRRRDRLYVLFCQSCLMTHGGRTVITQRVYRRYARYASADVQPGTDHVGTSIILVHDVQPGTDHVGTSIILVHSPLCKSGLSIYRRYAKADCLSPINQLNSYLCVVFVLCDVPVCVHVL